MEEELHLTEKLFWGIFDSLSHKVMTVLSEQKREHLSAPAPTDNNSHHLFSVPFARTRAKYFPSILR